MRKIYVFLLIILFSSNIHSQNFAWAKKLGGPNFDNGSSLAVDPSGNVLSFGYFNATGDYDPGAGTFNLNPIGTMDIFVSKLNSAGNFVWAKNIGAPGSQSRAYGGTTDAAGNIIFTGYFTGTADFDPGPGTSTLVSAGSQDIYVCKFDPNGNFLWVKQIGGTFIEEGHSVVTDASGNIYSTGFFNGAVDFDPGPGVLTYTAGSSDPYIQKLDPSGNLIWAKQYTIGDVGNDLCLDNSNNVYLTGQGPSSTFVSKQDALGNMIWSNGINASLEDALGVRVDASGNVICTGYFNGTADFDPGVGVSNMTSSSYDVFVQKLDPNGNFVWANQMGGSSIDWVYSIDMDASGNIYTTGSFLGTADFDPGPAVFNLSGGGVFLSKLDNNGNFVWALSNTGSDGQEVRLDAAGSIYCIGNFNNTTDFDPGAGVFNLSTLGGGDVFIQKLVTCAGAPSQPGTISGPSIFCSGAGSQTYSVSPVAGATSYNWSLPGGWTGTSITNTISVTTSTTSGNVSVTAGNGCGSSVPQTLSVTINQTPSAPAVISGSISICEFTSQTYSVTPVSGATSYSWSTPGGFTGTSATNILTVTAGSNSGNITVSASNACGSSTAQILAVQVNNVPLQPSPINGSVTMCSGSGPKTYSVTFASSALNYIWTLPGGWTGSSTSNTISATPGTSGTISVVATYSCGTSPTRTLAVTVNTTPTVNAGSSQTITCISPNVNLNGSGVTTYTWSGPGIVSGGNTASPIVNASGTYSLVGSTSGCNSNTATVVVSSNTTPPSVSIGSSSTTICSGSSATLTANGATTYTWSTSSNSTSIVVTPGSTQTYTVSGTNSVNGCTGSSSQLITVNLTPTASAGSSQTITCSSPNVNLTGSGVSTYTWTGPGIVSGGNSASPVINATGTYSLVGTTSGCKSNTATVIVVSNTVAPSVSIGSSSTTICSGSSVTLTANGANTYTWSTSSNATSIVVSPISSQTYTVTGTNTTNGCSASSSQAVTVNTTPTISVSGGAICPGNSFTITPSGALTYTYSGGSQVVSPGSTTNYTVSGSSAAGCIATPVVITVTVAGTLTVTISGANSVCNGSSINLTGGGATTYTWNTGATTTTIAPTPSVSTTYSIVGASGSCTNTAMFSVTVNPLPVVTAITSASIICGPPFQGTATITASGASTYTWNTTATTTAIAVSPSITTVYTVTGTDVNGCVNSTSFTQSVSACTGISEPNIKSELIIYPNPTSGVVTIKAKEGLQITVYNIIGELILNTELKTDTMEIYLNNQANGIYFIRIGSVTKKIIKE